MTMRFIKTFVLPLLACLALFGSMNAQARGHGPLFAVPDADKGRTDLATLVLPVALDLEMVDGFVYPGFRNMFRKGDIEVKVLPGEREIALQYNQLFQIDADNHEVVKSKVVVLKFVAAAGKTYRATHEQFRNADAARAGTKNFVVRIEDDQGVNCVVGASQVERNWKGEETTTSRRDLVSEAAAAAAIPAPVAPATAPGAVIDQLKAAWQNASAADRAAFMDWARANP
jgi:uncharacterized protein YccT (UPF0319 family)